MSGEPRWADLEADFPTELVAALRRHYEGGGGLPISARDLAKDRPEATELLEEAERRGWLEPGPLRWWCLECGRRLDRHQCAEVCSESPDDDGPHDCDSEPTWVVAAPLEVEDTEWLLALHGMNTTGAWQEAFNWRVSMAFGHMVPTAIYKYGIVRPGAVLGWRQRQLRDQLIDRLRRFRAEATETGFGARPAVIAHSFGTLLLGRALEADPQLKVGKVILTGCILPPDFDWARLFERRQVEAVLNHYGTKDFWAVIAHYVIPGSGPAGRFGFDPNDSRVINLPAEGFSHSQFFEESELVALFAPRDPEAGAGARGGPWWEFLRLPVEVARSRLGPRDPDAPWTPAGWLWRARLWRWLGLAIALWLAILLPAAALGRAAWLHPDWALRGLGAPLGLAAILYLFAWRLHRDA